VTNKQRGAERNRDSISTMKRRGLLAVFSGMMTSLAGCADIVDDSASTPEPPEGTTETTRTTSPEETESITETETTTTSKFERKLDAVDDLGCDPTGKQPCDDALEEGVRDRSVIEFPPGTYRFERGHHFADVDILGFVGKGEVTFVPPDGDPVTAYLLPGPSDPETRLPAPYDPSDRMRLR